MLVFVFLVLYFLKRKYIKTLLAKNQMLEKEIMHLNKEITKESGLLKDRIGQETKDLLDEIDNQKSIELQRKIALKKAEESIFLKNAFFSNLSFEMRTPLNGIIGYSQLLLSKVESKDDPDLEKLAKVISESSNRLLNLMENIIDLSRIDNNDYQIKFTDFEVNKVINSCIEKIKKLNDKKQLTLEFKQSETFKITGDKYAFEKALDLILDNAFLYTPDGGISVSLQIDSLTNKLRVLVSDTGIGIDNSFLPTIFDSYKPNNTGFSRHHQGAGLGLPLAYKLIFLMGGELQIKSQKNNGTHISMLFPLFDSLSSDTSKIQRNIPPLAHNKINLFVVEDDKMNRLVLEHMLSHFTQFQMSVDGEDALKQMEDAMNNQLNFNLILLDINLPAPWNGMLLLKEFKKRWPILNTIPFVAQTAYAIAGDKEKFLAAGFDDYISKPIDKIELYTIIENNIHKFNQPKQE